jgi:hypothetical protein
MDTAPTRPAARAARPLQAAISRARTNKRLRKLVDIYDDKEVRRARKLAVAVRSARPPDVVAFGDSNWVYCAPYDDDLRPLGTMIADALAPDAHVHVTAGAGYYPTLISAYARLIKQSGARPVVVVPLCARLTTVAWSTHPNYSYLEAIARIESFDASTPTWKMRMKAVPRTDEQFRVYGDQVISTWAGTGPISQFRDPLRDPVGHGLDEDERLRLLYAFHHGEAADPAGRPLAEVERMGRVLRDLGVEVVPFESSMPVDAGVALWGEQFRENAQRTFDLLGEAFRRGYGAPIEVLRTGLVVERSELIDPSDGSEHMNQHGRARVAGHLTEAVQAALARRG